MAKGKGELERTPLTFHLDGPSTPPSNTNPEDAPNGLLQPDGEIPGNEADILVPPNPNENLETTPVELVNGDGDDGKDAGTLQDGCTHGWYPGATIGLSVLSVALILVLVLMTIRMGSMKRALNRRRGKKPPKDAPTPVAAPAAAAPGGVIQVGKLHCLGDRESQQDCLAVSPENLYGSKGMLAVVADGMGGLSDGDKMSQTAASTMMNGFMNAREFTGDSLMALVLSANQAVNQLLGPNQGRSGTTLVSGIIKDGLFSYVSVGDSRICLYRQGMLTQLNREHVYRNELIVQAINGVGTLWDSNTHPKAAGLTSYLGMGNLKYVDIPAEPIRLRAGDKIILMSDGVYNAMTLPEMESALALPAQQAADSIGQSIAAKAYRHQDNYTAVILEV